jgi:hypothetical protein
MKGWVQTFIVHNSHPRELLADLGLKGFLGFQVYVGSMILSGPLHTMFMLSLATSALVGGIVVDAWFALSCFIFLVGYGGPAALAVAGLSRLGRADLIPVQVLLPIYWMLHSLAGLRALHELITRPYFWAKTQHGETRLTRQRSGRGAPAQAE